ncbi:MAG: outer membrane lipoprotein-sorting protein [Treponema sp.]|nr:outer membrane lipoprotein-sorting protein [Spirochaetales bacterium]MDY4523451.1 outer membrane lipoprotein-sorting protein [Treponema sp.]MDY4831525.1 outer membrane lipoprotein-sorting protein [Treponema sp.]MDY5917582.1 outer membrane lipoprotein-sorting protein [Treponema sp.]MDY6189955.1 outer membrane lipoprotein-sorting protein [Treponema sp.]
MKKIILTFLLGAAVFASGFAQVSEDIADKAFKIMENTEDILAYHGDYSATMSLVIDKPGKPRENLQYKVFQRTDDNLMTLVQLFPEADKGVGYLRDNENIWSYDPISRKFSHTSIKEALGDSDVKLDDVDQAKTKWRENYEVTAYEEGTLGKFAVDIITLTAKTTDPAYAKSKYYIRKDIPLLLKEEDFSGSDRLMRTILLPKYAKVPAGYVATQAIMRDELNKGEQTQQVISDLTFDKLPDRIFTKAYLEGLN